MGIDTTTELARCEKTPSTLLRDMQDGSEFEFLVRRLSRQYARRISDLEDCEQEARIAVLEGLREYRAEDSSMSLKNYLGFRIRHALKEYVRSKYRPGMVSLDAEHADDSSASLHDKLGIGPQQEGRLSASIAAEEIGTLPETQRRALLLLAEGLSLTEIGEELGVCRQVATRHVHKAQRALAKAAA